MNSQNNVTNLKIFGIKAIHFAACTVLFFIFWILFRYNEYTRSGTGYRYNYYMTIAYALLLLFFSRVYNVYLLGYSRIRELVFSQLLSQLFSAGIVWLGVSVAWKHFNNPLMLLALSGIQFVLDIAWSYAATGYYFRIVKRKRTILIYRDALDRHRLGNLAGKTTGRLFEIVKEIRFDGKYKEIQGQLKGYDAVFVAGVNSRCRNGILKYCQEEGIHGFFLPHVGDAIMQSAIHVQSLDSPVMYVNRKSLTPEYMLVKRVSDIAVSGLALVMLSPVIGITALAVRMYDHGPVLYQQVRLTKDGRKFRILKFRSMRVDAEKDGVARLSTGDSDDRITPVGKVIRKCRLDELPQLINILKGDMSIVGPRPERPEIAKQYYEKMPDFRLRLQVKAGLTGYAQVYGKYNTDPYEKLEFDLLYIKDMGILTDLKLMFATVGILFSGDSTQGIAEGQTTAAGECHTVSSDERSKAYLAGGRMERK